MTATDTDHKTQPRASYTVKEFLARNPISAKTFWRQVKLGKLPIVRIGRRVLVSAASEAAWLATKLDAIEKSRTTNKQEYRSWQGMLQRCGNANDEWYSRYGGRGIKVCEQWMRFDNFFEDMGRKPSPAHTIDRIDNDGNYEPGNCRWATRKEQANNRAPRSGTHV